MFPVGGRNPVLEALRAGQPIQRLLIARGLEGGPLAAIRELATARAIPIVTASRAQLDELVPRNQGVVAILPAFPYASLDDICARAAQVGEPAMILALDLLQDPQNFGSLIRTADAVGCHGIIIPLHRQVGVTPAVVKASAGAAFYLPIAQVVNLARTLARLKDQGLWVIGIEANGPSVYDEVDWRMPFVLVVGSEGRGLGRLVREHCDLLVRLPMRGHVGSLNAAVAGSIALYHAWRARR